MLFVVVTPAPAGSHESPPDGWVMGFLLVKTRLLLRNLISVTSNVLPFKAREKV